jgi:hypothetical protein
MTGDVGPLHSPEHRQAVGRVIIAGSGVESTVAAIAAQLLPDPSLATRVLPGMASEALRTRCRDLVAQRVPETLRLREELLAWLDRVDWEIEQRNRVVHATWLRVDKPEPGSVAFAHYGKHVRATGHVLVEQVPIPDLDRVGEVMESVLTIGLVLLGKVEDFVDGSYTEPDWLHRRPYG